MEFDQILPTSCLFCWPPYMPCRANDQPRVASLSITSFLAPRLACLLLPRSAFFFDYVPLWKGLSDLLPDTVLLFGETVHSSLARARERERGRMARFPFLAISFVCSSSIGDFLAYNVSKSVQDLILRHAIPAIHPTSSCDSNKSVPQSKEQKDSNNKSPIPYITRPLAAAECSTRQPQPSIYRLSFYATRFRNSETCSRDVDPSSGSSRLASGVWASELNATLRFR